MGRKYKSYTYEEYMKAMELLEKGYGLTETCRLLGWPEKKEPILYYWKHGKHKPPLARWMARPSIELAYAIGVFHGDACVTKDEARYQYIVKLDTIDKEFAITFSRAMARILNRKYIEPRWDKKHECWKITYKSKAFFTWYKNAEKQGLQGFKPYIEHDIETVRYYLRGLYDGEGYNYKNERVHLYNTNKELLEYAQYLLEKFFHIIATGPYLQKKNGTKMMINGIKHTRKHDCYEIDISRKKHIQKFLREIGFTIIRKQLGLKKHERVFVEGRYIEPYRLVELGLFKLPFNQ